ncbi:hypothetical protein IWX49DRAFT_165297 [Phyllosticta citricarpa]
MTRYRLFGRGTGQGEGNLSWIRNNLSSAIQLLSMAQPAPFFFFFSSYLALPYLCLPRLLLHPSPPTHPHRIILLPWFRNLVAPRFHHSAVRAVADLTTPDDFSAQPGKALHAHSRELSTPSLPLQLIMSGVRRIYNLLVAMRYIPESELIWPPHDKLQSVLAPLGFDSRVIQILCHIPFLKNTVIQRASPELDHGTYGINYLDSGEAEDMLEVSRPDEILLFKSCSDFGNFYVYNVSSQTMKLATPFQLYSKEQGRNEFDRLSPRPAAKVLGDLADSFTNLTLVPMRGLSGFQLSSSLPGSDTEIKRLYARNGWPRKFNGEQFEKDLAAWLERESQKGSESIARMTRVSAVEAQTGAPNTKSMRSTRSLRERLHMIRRKSTFA